MEVINYQPPGQFEETRFEKIHNIVFNDSKEGSIKIAHEIAALIKHKQSINTNCVLGLATGSSPIGVYNELIRLHKEEDLSFYNVVSFNLDEYYGLTKTNIQSYYHFMHEHLFNEVDIKPENVHIPDGQIPLEALQNYCMDYEKKIETFGGLDFQLLGIGRTGHIGFNEPGSHINSITRIVTLDYITRQDAAKDFLGIEKVPKKAITMGITTIQRAKRIVLMGWGQHKSSIIKKTIEGAITSFIPATYLQNHKNTTVILDKEAAQDLTRYKTPWLVEIPEWTESLRKKAIAWLCEHTKKPILNLTEKDYNNNGMSDLLLLEGSAYDLNIKMFNELQHTITGWPGGKPNTDNSRRPERAVPEKKRVIIFSPHPDDDVISMGGTFDRLIEQGHEVHIAYQTSGNIAVTDEETLKFLEVATYMQSESDNQTLIDALKNKEEGSIDAPEIRKLKGLIRQSESYAATRYLGLDDKNVHFLDMPFYETGKVKKNPLSAKDVRILEDIINNIKPHQVYAAGDLADPHGTHKVCLDALFMALENIKHQPYMNDCWVWLYRGAWHEWDIHEIDMAVPMSPDQVIKKRRAIFYHQSQKDNVMFQGEDMREFWMRAEHRNQETANKYKALGLAEYAAIEAFVRYHF